MHTVRKAMPLAGTARRYTQLPRFFRWFSNHCVLRQLDDADIARINAVLTHPDFARCWGGAAPQTEAEVAEFVRTAQTEWLRGNRYLMAVVRKQSHDFVGWVELRAIEKGAWMLRWFVQPDFAERDAANEMLLAAADLMFTALDAQKLYANCPRGHVLFERLLNGASFIELVPAGSLDHVTGQPRRQSLYELGVHDWKSLSAAPHHAAGAVSSAVAWIAKGARAELALV
ncbi:MAG TPA: GNAT family N-acetyltransferase [Burkholderiaceae bacterium]|nr:GNAT family N-acetyltransferase [Burkholderiaceae bacterium]